MQWWVEHKYLDPYILDFFKEKEKVNVLSSHFSELFFIFYVKKKILKTVITVSEYFFIL